MMINPDDMLSNEEYEELARMGWPECGSKQPLQDERRCPLCLTTGHLVPVPWSELLPENES